MNREELIELSQKLGMNQSAVKYHFEINSGAAEAQIIEAAKFMGLIKGDDKNSIQK